jgi:hypothetical protein
MAGLVIALLSMQAVAISTFGNALPVFLTGQAAWKDNGGY